MTAKLIENNSFLETLDLSDELSRPLAVMRLDKNDTQLSGNKLFKLQPWLQAALEKSAGLLSCGGAYSNHLHALAAAGKRYGIKTAGLVRGLEKDKLTYTMQDCVDMGMQLIPVTRQVYANRYQDDFPSKYLQLFDEPMLWVPEGGTDLQAVKACEQIAVEINKVASLHAFDALWLAVGSGGTLAGIVRALNPAIKIRAVPVMKNYQPVKMRLSEFLTQEQQSRIDWVEGGWYGGFGCFKQADIDHFSRIFRPEIS